MPIIEAKNFPFGLDFENDNFIQDLRLELKNVVMGIVKLGIKHEKQVTVLFSSDIDPEFNGKIIVFIYLHITDDRTREVKLEMAKAVYKVFKAKFPCYEVSVWPISYDKDEEGYYSGK